MKEFKCNSELAMPISERTLLPVTAFGVPVASVFKDFLKRASNEHDDSPPCRACTGHIMGSIGPPAMSQRLDERVLHSSTECTVFRFFLGTSVICM